MQKCEDLENKLENAVLTVVTFRNSSGGKPRSRQAVASIEFEFSDGAKLALPNSELRRPAFDAIRFRLTPKEMY